ncbi:hypothetical protein M9458_036869, partial [Cirrhinus mrigala]
SWTPPRPSDPAVPPRLLASSSPLLPVGPPAPPGSLVTPALPWSVVVPPSPLDSTPPAAPCHSIPPAPFLHMALPSVGSTVGRHHSCGLGLAWLLLLRVPSVSTLALPSIVTTLDCVWCSPPGSLSSANASSYRLSVAFPRPLLCFCFRREVREMN